jgi:hypothetical protein
VKRLLLPLALTLLLVPSAVAWPLYSPVVVAEGKVHFYLIDDATGTVLCARSGLVAVEVDVEGRVAWHAPGCDEAYTPAARTFPDCRVTEAEASCGGAGHFTLARWGKFVYRGAPVDGVRVEMDGVLTVPTTLPPT